MYTHIDIELKEEEPVYRPSDDDDDDDVPPLDISNGNA